MRKKKNQALLPFVLLATVLLLSVGGLILANQNRKAQITDPGDYTSPDDIPRVTAEEAYQAVMNSEAVLIDTRSSTSYQAQHATGAINLLAEQVESRLGELDPDTWYLTYCT